MKDEENMTALLLRLTGPRQNPSAERTSRVREVVHREWQMGRRRRLIREGILLVLGGVAATLLVVVWINRSEQTTQVSPQVVAFGQRVEGQPLIMHPSRRPAISQVVTVWSSIYAADVIQTDDASRVALVTGDGSSVRVDRRSSVRFFGPTTMEVTAGAVYVSTSAGSHGFKIRTPFGAVRDLGTQFEVRMAATNLRLRVRSGHVEIRHDGGLTTAESGTEATVTGAGITLRPMAPYGSEWTWTTEVAPAFTIEGRTLGAFLEHLAVEEGWTLQYANAAVAAAAARIVLHGSVEGLKPEDALGATLPTSGLEYRLREGVLTISPPAHTREIHR